jgi:transaldolase
MENNPLTKIGMLGQSIWLDYICRDLIASGNLGRLIKDDGVRGITSNPSIFEKAIGGSHDYDEDIRAMVREGKDVNTIYETLSQRDVRSAADEFLPVFDKTKGIDGYVSLEVNPHLAHNTKGTMQEARRLWAVLNRPNVMIKVPATLEGLPVVEQLISEGINVNVTLLFGIPRYLQVVQAYLAGLEKRTSQGLSINGTASVASFFISRIDTQVDPILEKIVKKGGKEAELAKTLYGQVAIASAKVAYQIYKENFVGSRFKNLQNNGAHTQRLLWASTSTKNPEYSDVKYIESLIGLDTINTIPVETMDAYRDHGKPEARIEREAENSRRLLNELSELGINIDELTQQLEDDGIEKFNQSFDKLMETLQKAMGK